MTRTFHRLDKRKEIPVIDKGSEKMKVSDGPPYILDERSREEAMDSALRALARVQARQIEEQRELERQQREQSARERGWDSVRRSLGNLQGEYDNWGRHVADLTNRYVREQDLIFGPPQPLLLHETSTTGDQLVISPDTGTSATSNTINGYLIPPSIAEGIQNILDNSGIARVEVSPVNVGSTAQVPTVAESQAIILGEGQEIVTNVRTSPYLPPDTMVMTNGSSIAYTPPDNSTPRDSSFSTFNYRIREAFPNIFNNTFFGSSVVRSGT